MYEYREAQMKGMKDVCQKEKLRRNPKEIKIKKEEFKV